MTSRGAGIPRTLVVGGCQLAMRLVEAANMTMGFCAADDFAKLYKTRRY